MQEISAIDVRFEALSHAMNKAAVLTRATPDVAPSADQIVEDAKVFEAYLLNRRDEADDDQKEE